MRLVAATLLIAFASGGWVSATRAGAPPTLPLEPRAARIGHVLSGWASRNAPLSSAPCRLARSSDERALVAPTYIAPKDLRPGAEIDLTIAQWRTAALARFVTESVGSAKMLGCIGAHQQLLYKRLYHRTVTIRFDLHLPAWVQRDPRALLHGYTQTIHVPGYQTSLVYVEVAFLDKSDPRVAWSAGFFYYGQASFVPLFNKILAAAESAQHTI